MSNPDANLLIKTKVWKKDNVELIDYLNRDTINTFFRVNGSGVLRKQNKTVSFHPGDNLEKTDMDLVKIQKNNNTWRYSISCGTWSKNLEEVVDQQGIFMVYRGLTLKDLNKVKTFRYYKLSQGDIIKLGRIYLKVLEIHVNKKTINSKKAIQRNNMLHSSKSSSIIINQQQIIKGIYSPKWNSKKHSQILFNLSNSILTARNNNQLKNNNDSIDLFTKRRILPLLPRINSNNELFVLKKISKSKKTKSSQDLGDIILKQSIKLQKNKPACRICYGEENTEENPLICPCICKGSMRYIHYLCLKNWLNSKIEEEMSEDSGERNPDCISYNRKDIACELCKEKFPDYIIHNGVYYNILFYKPKFEEFIVLESMKSSIVKNKYIHVISLENKEFISIGRATESDLSLPELSVSRNHCLIHKEHGKVYLEDNTSKFGTLVLIQNKNMIVNDFMTLKIQVGKTFAKFKLEIPFSFSWSCCGRSDTVERMDYQVQNRKGFDVMSCFVIKEDNWHKKINYLDSEDAVEDKDNNKKIIEDNNNNKDINNDKVCDDKNNINENNHDINKDNNDNKVDEKEGKIIDLIDKDNESLVNNKSNNSNNNINKSLIHIKENEEIAKEKESLIDKSSVDDDKKSNLNNKDNININNHIKEEEKENKKENNNDIIDYLLNTKNQNDNSVNKNEISSMVNNLLSNHIKRISIKKGKNDKLELPKLDQIKIENIKENISISLLSERNNNFHKIKVNEEKNDKNKTILNQTDSFSNNKNGNNILSFSPLGAHEPSGEIINNIDNINK